MASTSLVLPILIAYLAAILLLPSNNQVDAIQVKFERENAMPKGNIKSFDFKSRIILPYGPDLYGSEVPQSPNEQPYRGYGPGMGASETVQYDHLNHFFYSASDQGYILVADYADPSSPKISNYSFKAESKLLGSISICPNQGVMLLSLSDKGRIDVYDLVSRDDPKVPQLLKSIDCGSNAKNVLASSDCGVAAIANLNAGEGLAQGSVTIIQGVLSEEPKRTTIPLDYNAWDDDYLLRRGLNMPMTKKALEYWDDYSHLADDLDFTDLRNNYKSSIFLEPESLAWGPDEKELLVNMQQNNGLLRINMTDLSPVAVAGYGMKDHSFIPVDINANDGDCNLKTYPSLFAMRNPDQIASLKYNDKHYVITANEDGGKEYEDWEEAIKSNDLFQGSNFRLQNVVVPKAIFDENNTAAGHSALFNNECQDSNDPGAEQLCLKKVELSVGSNSIDFESDPMNPIFYRMVLFGGRGWSIYELPENPRSQLKLVFDSGDVMEREGCSSFPWSHNALMDEELAPFTGPNNTFVKAMEAEGDLDVVQATKELNDPAQDGCFDQGDGTPGSCPLSQMVDSRSGKDGAGVENVVMGEACGRLVAAMATEKSSIAMLFDITDITTPELLKVFHLSPAAQNKSFGLAYNDGEIGEIDAESGVFLSAEESPSGKAGILFAGALSGTVSWWEFDCKEESPSSSKRKSSKQAESAASSVKFRMPSSWATMLVILMAGSFGISDVLL
ncbi:unnamed protein product [Cylindrotheca closterium]|uniref:Choice-of-anchor I domain-containing protein n=1 Tax=Cylindrotheca closterium TaxID=2856 RepID=A0AAD2G5G4_9STRA|nr:unnamed protein product [Cylindrotheca closterium]